MNRNFIRFSIIVSLLFTLSCCSTQQPLETEKEVKNTSVELPFQSPATFTGTIPCENCAGIDITLNILPDTMYQLRKTFRNNTGPAKIESQIGKWLYLPTDNLLILGKQQGLLKTYVIESSNTLHFVEWEGTDNASQIQYKLLRAGEVDPFEDLIKIKGDFYVKDGIATMTECSTGQTFAVSQGKGYATLLQNYMNTPHQRNQPLLSSAQVKIVRGVHDTPELFIEHFNNIYPDQNCEGDKIKTSLTDTFWYLQEVDGLTVTMMTGENKAYLFLNSDRSFKAYGGCNEISGIYLVKGDLFLIDRKRDIRLACPSGIGVENKLIKAFKNTKSFRMEDDMLELLDESGRVGAGFRQEPANES